MTTATTLPAVSMIGLADSEQFKYLLNELANGGNNPKHRRALVRELREAVKACANAQRQASAVELHGLRWILTDEALPEPYEEVRILFDGLPRIARLNHDRTVFQLATFLDSTKHQYVAPIERVAGWTPLPMERPL